MRTNHDSPKVTPNVRPRELSEMVLRLDTGKVNGRKCTMKPGYFTCGENAGSGRSTTWEYNPSEDLWTERTSFEGGTRSEAVGFSLDNRGFVLTGKSGTTQYDDMWEFFPTQEYDSND